MKKNILYSLQNEPDLLLNFMTNFDWGILGIYSGGIFMRYSGDTQGILGGYSGYNWGIIGV